MENYRIKVKIGEHEFEAEGPAEIVQGQFETFKQLIASQPQRINTTEKTSKQEESGASGASGNGELQLDRICRVEGRIVSLTVKPEEASAAMLIMLGQKTFRDNETVTSSEIKDGLEHSGYRPGRIDRIMQPLADEGSVIRIGQRKGTRYRFTNPGTAKAKVIAKTAIEQVTE
ncbi:MAG: hypothetical protein ABSE40_19490 [Candidatus Sulfotelmatobacter sp.]|jgi:hypothetical protein